MNDWARYEEAVKAGWKPTVVDNLTAHPCRGGCGRVYTAQPQDELGNYLRMHSYLCLDCRMSIKGFLGSFRRRTGTSEAGGHKKAPNPTPPVGAATGARLGLQTEGGEAKGVAK